MTTDPDHRTLRRELGLAFGVTAVWPITVVALAIMCWAVVAQLSGAQRERERVAARVGRQTTSHVALTTRSMEAAAALHDPAAMTPGQLGGLLNRILTTQTELVGLSFVNAEGRLVAAAGMSRRTDADAGAYAGSTDTAVSAVASGEPAVGFDEVMRRHVVTYAVPTIDPQTGRASGVFVGVGPLDAFEDLLADIDAETGGSSYLVGEDGRMVGDRDVEGMLDGVSVLEASAGIVRGLDGGPAVAATAPLRIAGTALTVVSARPLTDAMAPAAFAIVPSALLLGLVAVSRRVRDRVTRHVVEPVEALAATTRTLAEGDLTARVASSDIVEFDRLASDFNGMAERLEHTVDSLADRTRRLADSNRQLEDFASIAAHDLREPLRKVQFFGDRLRKLYGDQLEEQGRDYVARMSGAAGRMADLIDSLLSYSRVSTKAAPFEPVNLSEIARQVLSDLEPRVAETGADVTVGALPVVEADPTQMRQLLQNLIGNALKYRAPDRPARVVVTASRDGAPPSSGPAAGVGGHSNGDPVRLRVEDNGIGIDPAKHEDIFRVFTRLHGRSEYEGTGIGLAVCRRIAERHGGSITVESHPGEGSAFVVSLPRHRSLEPA